jgi:hypothetical protein
VFQRATIADFDESHLTDQGPRRPTRFAGTFRDDGIEDVAGIALGAGVIHVQTLSASYSRDRFAWWIVPPDKGYMPPVGRI